MCENHSPAKLITQINLNTGESISIHQEKGSTDVTTSKAKKQEEEKL